MEAVVGILLVGVFAYLAAGGMSMLGGRAGILARAWAATGAGFLLVGVLLGPFGFEVFTEGVFEDLLPLVDLLVGWIGWTLGSQLSRRNLKRVDRRAALWAAGDLVWSAGLCAAVLAGFGALSGHWASRQRLAALVVAAGMSAPLGVGLVLGPVALRGRSGRLLTMHASLSPILGLVSLALAQVAMFPDGYVALQVPVGAVLGLAFVVLTLHRMSDRDLLVMALGFVALGSGLALVLGGSPLVVNLSAGFVVAVLSPQQRRIAASLQTAEKPVYLLLLAALGAALDVRMPGWAWGAAALLLAGRLAAKAGTALLASRFHGLDWSRVSVGLSVQGGVVPAMALSAGEGQDLWDAVFVAYASMAALATGPLLGGRGPEVPGRG